MEDTSISSPPPPPPTTTTTKTLDLDHQIQPSTTPKQQQQQQQHLPPPFTNGVLKRLKPHHHHPIVITYKECLKNHAASIGGHAVDGCGEFMPSPTSTPDDPTSLKCAACGCHRNFHRRDPDTPFPTTPPFQHVIEYQPHHRHHPPPPPQQPQQPQQPQPQPITPPNSPSPPPISSSYYPSAPHMLLALSSGTNNNNGNSDTRVFSAVRIGPNNKKRFRTKFTQHQKEKMHELAERVEWKMQKKDEDLIIRSCNEIGVDKGVFKVWMHNNKMTFGSKKDSDNNVCSSGGVDFFMNRNNHHQEHDEPERELEPEPEAEQRQNNESGSSGGGSSSS